MSQLRAEAARIELSPAEQLDADRVLRRLADDTAALAMLAAGIPAPLFDPPAATGREQLLTRLDQDRRELATVAAQLRGPVQALETARNALVFTGKSLRWIGLAGNLAAIAMSLGKGRRPPITLLLGASVQLLGAWWNRAASDAPAKLRHTR